MPNGAGYEFHKLPAYDHALFHKFRQKDGSVKTSLRIFTPLELARQEIQLRRANVELRLEIERSLGPNMWSEMLEQPRGVLFRCLPSPDNGFTYFYQASNWLGLTPFPPEYTRDKFVPLNSEKHGLARLRLTLPDGTRATCDILNWKSEEGKRLSEVVLKSGETLASFHHRLFDVAGYVVELRDLSDWFSSRSPPANFYFYYLSHFLVHGVLFEAIFEDEDPNEDRFTHEVIYPNIERIEKEFGLRPLIVQLYPPDQTSEEDFYWWSYPPQVNEYLVKWARENNLVLKPWKAKHQ